MGNRHIPVQRLPTPYLFSRKGKQKKNVRLVWDRHGPGGSSSLGLEGFCHVAVTTFWERGDGGNPSSVLVDKHKIVSTMEVDEIQSKCIITVKLCLEMEISVIGDFGRPALPSF